MKYLLNFVIALTIIGCSTENTTTNGNSNLQHYKIDYVKSYLPSNYFKESNLIYKNSLGEEIIMRTQSKESSSDRIHNGIDYKTDEFNITMYNQQSADITIVLSGNVNLSTQGNVVATLGGVLMPFNSSGTTWSTIRFEDNKPAISLGDDFRETYNVMDTEFINTYVTIGKNGNEQHSAYSELNINAEQGVVAFRDENNDLWVFDRFEE